MQFSPDRKRRSHKQNQCSASDSVGLIFTRSYRSTLLITTPTTTPSLVKTSLYTYSKRESSWPPTSSRNLKTKPRVFLKVSTSQVAHLQKFSLNVSSSSFVVLVNLLHP